MQSTLKTVWLLALCQSAMLSGQALMLAAVPFVSLQLSSDKSLATLPIGLQFCATLLATVPASLLMKRWGRRTGFTIGAVIGIASSLLAALAIWKGQFVWFCGALAVMGISNGFAIYFRFAAADAAGPKLRSRAISLVVGGGVVAALIGPNLARFTADIISGVPFTASFIGLAAIYGLMLLALRFTTIPWPSEVERTRSGRPLTAIARQPAFIVAVFGGMVGYAVMNLIMIATPLAMHDHQYPFGDAAFIIQWHMLGMYAPSFVTGQLIERHGVLRVMQWGAALCALCSLLNLVNQDLVTLWFALVALGVGWNFVFVSATALLTETYAPEEKAKAQAINDLLIGISTAFTALSAGSLQHALSWGGLNSVVLPFTAAIFIAVLWLQRLRRLQAPHCVAHHLRNEL